MKWAVIVETKEGAKLKGEYEDFERILEVVEGMEDLFGVSKVELIKAEPEEKTE